MLRNKYHIIFLAILCSYGYAWGASNTTLQLPITINPFVQDSIQLGDLTHALIQSNGIFFANVTFSDIVKTLCHETVSQLEKDIGGMIVLGLAAQAHGLTVDRFEFIQPSKWTITMSVQELANISNNITLPLTDTVALIAIQEAMFKVLEKRFNFKTEEIAERFNITKDEIYALLEPGWIKVVNFITEKNILALSTTHKIPPICIAEALNLSLSELYNSTLPQLDDIRKNKIDIIKVYPHDCYGQITCTNNTGSYTCACNAGWTGSGLICDDIDECTVDADDCDGDVRATCTNIPGSFTCACNAGYSGHGKNCIDINECQEDTHYCNANASCTNTRGSYSCACNVGFTGNGFVCQDINECALGWIHVCSGNGFCTNTIGSYTCECNLGYIGNGLTCTTPDPDSLDNNIAVILGVVVAVLVVIIAVIVIVGCIFYRRMTRIVKKQDIGNIENPAYDGDRDTQPQRRLPQIPYSDRGYEEPSHYSQLDSSKMVSIDANYQSLIKTQGSSTVVENGNDRCVNEMPDSEATKESTYEELP